MHPWQVVETTQARVAFSRAASNSREERNLIKDIDTRGSGGICGWLASITHHSSSKQASNTGRRSSGCTGKWCTRSTHGTHIWLWVGPCMDQTLLFRLQRAYESFGSRHNNHITHPMDHPTG